MTLDDKTKELIAIGASLTANCHPCLQFHVELARKFGADEQAISGAIEIGRQVRRGAANKTDKLAAGLVKPDCPSGVGEVCCG